MSGAAGGGPTQIPGMTPASGAPAPDFGTGWRGALGQFLGSNMQQPVPGQERQPGNIMGLLESPAFNIGMGLLAHRADKSKSIAQAILGGMTNAQKQQLGADKREREDRLRDLLEDFFKNSGQTTAQTPSGPTGDPLPGDVPFNPQQSLVPGGPQMSPTPQFDPRAAQLQRMLQGLI